MFRRALFVSFALVAIALWSTLMHAEPSDFDKLSTQAEKLYAAGNFKQARDLYAQLRPGKMTPDQRRWTAFRLADTLWRHASSAGSDDSDTYREAEEGLLAVVNAVRRVEERDRSWVEAQESLGDFYWLRRNTRMWGSAWQHYEAALDYWAGAKDLKVARDRYLETVFRMVDGWEQDDGDYYYSYLPAAMMENVLKLARDPSERARARYLLAMSLMYQGDWEGRQRIPLELAEAIRQGKGTAWYDDALFRLAELLSTQGRLVMLPNGSWRQEPDFAEALELYRRLIKEFKPGQTRYYDQAKARITEITEEALSVSVSNIFLPGSEVEYSLSWRNVDEIDISLYPMEITKDARFGSDRDPSGWLSAVDLGGRKPILHSVVQTKDAGQRGPHFPGSKIMREEQTLATGAYLLEARAGKQKVRELILITDASLLLKTAEGQALTWFTDARTGEPIPKAQVHLWERWWENGGYRWKDQTLETDKDGLAVFALSHKNSHGVPFVSASLSGRQAFATSYNSYSPADSQGWRIYAFTDRPAYRPGDTVQWKLTARKYRNSEYFTPVNEALEVEIYSPRGDKIKADKIALNRFGSAWGELTLTADQPLGEYRATFFTKGRQIQIGQATLFRIEEYKLPEFKVSVRTPEVDGRKLAFRVGEKVEAQIQADYYFGGPVANATVEVLVYQNSYYQQWRPTRDYPWFYDFGPVGYRGQGQIIKRETLKTDASGKASLTFDTPRNQGDLEYRIEARVTDSSRREISGEGSVRVTRQRYYVYLTPDHSLFKPQDKVEVALKAQDANEQPVEARGTIKVSRDHWYQIWLDPNGKEVKGDALEKLRVMGPFPPAPKPDGRPWRLKFQGYLHEEVLSREVATDKEGNGTFTFTPAKEGYYSISWLSVDGDPVPVTPGGDSGAKASSKPQAVTGEGETVVFKVPQPKVPIQASTMVWVATRESSSLGYHSGLEVVVDKDTFRLGTRAPVMISTPESGHHVLFSVEADSLLSYQVVEVTGTAKLLEVEVTDKLVPNVWLRAELVSNLSQSVSEKEVVVPPEDHYLTVKLEADKSLYQPRDEASYTVTTLDRDGKPVDAEVALSVVDESIYYIQKDYAGDPRPFFFGQKRSHNVATLSTFNQKSYAMLITAPPEPVPAENLEGGDVLGSLDDGAGAVPSEELAEMDAPGAPAASRMSLAASAAPPPAPSMKKAMPSGGARAREEKSMDKDTEAGAAPEAPEQQGEAAVQVRSDFRATAAWLPNVATQGGKATVKVKLPDTLTTWSATARAFTPEAQLGQGTSSVKSAQPLIVRLQAPRFFLVGDAPVVSAVVMNNTDRVQRVTTSLETAGISVAGLYVGGKMVKGEPGPLELQPGKDGRVDWVMAITAEGEAKLKVTARGQGHADAMEKTLPVYPHGIERLLATAGKATAAETTFKLEVPGARRKESTLFTVQVAPTLAVTMLDALPYLLQYPYGCTEQTMSRFMPAVVVANTLKEVGLTPSELEKRIFGGIEQATAAKTHTEQAVPVKELSQVVKKGLERLYDFQHGDGGWGWWKDGESDLFMSAYVVWGLQLANQSGVSVRQGVVEKAMRYLDNHLVNAENSPDLAAWMLHAMSAGPEKKATDYQKKAIERLWKQRDRLGPYARALFALAAQRLGYTQEAQTLVANLADTARRDEAPDQSKLAPEQRGLGALATARWGQDGYYWRWHDGPVESTSFALMALLEVDPQNPRAEEAMNWLVKNRRGAQWSNTRDTAIAVLALNAWLTRSGELSAAKEGVEYSLEVNGKVIASKKLSGKDVFSAPSQFELEPKAVKDGLNSLKLIKKGGKGPLYYSASARFFSLEEPIPAGGSELFVHRQYNKRVGRPTLLKGYVYDNLPLSDGGQVKSGERVEVVVTVEVKNDYEYLLFEDLKPAGLEAVEIRSGESLYARQLTPKAADRRFGRPTVTPADQAGKAKTTPTASEEEKMLPPPAEDSPDYTGRTAWVYQELRDRKVALFVGRLEQGVWEIRYELRAEVPGNFHALPVLGQAMYVPELKGNSREERLEVLDRE